jgi:hypothetical protein
VIDFECPACNAQAQVSKQLAGHEFSCNGCGALLEIPSLEELGLDSGGFVEDNSQQSTIQVDPNQAGNSSNETIAIGSPIDQLDNETIAISREQAAAGETIQVGGNVSSPDGDGETISISPAQPGKDAFCGIHPERSARKICGRCGNFMCVVCSKDGRRSACPDCRNRGQGAARTFPFNKQNWTIGSVVDWSWNTFQKEWGMLVVGSVIVTVIGQVISQVLSVGAQVVGALAGPGNEFVVVAMVGGATLVSTLIQQILQLGIYKMMLDVARGGKAELGVMFSQLHKSLRLILQWVVGMIICFVPILVAGGLIGGICFGIAQAISPEAGVIVAVVTLIPLYFVAMAYLFMPIMVFMPIELAYNGDVGPVECAQNCFQMVSGQSWHVLGSIIVFGLIAMVGFFACCVGALFTIPLSQFMIVALYMALRNGSGLPPVRNQS